VKVLPYCIAPSELKHKAVGPQLSQYQRALKGCGVYESVSESRKRLEGNYWVVSAITMRPAVSSPWFIVSSSIVEI
jgi:hypothetical protein